MQKIKLTKLYSQHRMKAITALLLTVAAVFLGLVNPMIMAFVIDGVLLDKAAAVPAFVSNLYLSFGGRDFFFSRLWIFAILMLVVYLLQATANYTRNMLMSRFAQAGTVELRRQLFSHIQRLPWAWHKLAETGDLVQRCTSDVRLVNQYFDRQLMRITESGLTFLITTYLMLRFDFSLGLVALAVTPILFITSLIYFRKRRANWELWEEAEGALAARLQETASGIRVVKAFAREDFEYQAFNQKNVELYDFSLKNFRIMGRFWFWSDLLIYGEFALIVIFGTWLVLQGRLTPGLLVLFTFYAEKLLYPLRNLARLIAQTGNVQIASRRLREILNASPEPDEKDLARPELSGAIRLENVSFAYPDSDEEILTDLSLEIKPGETIGILGPTGSGKSTLLLLLQKLYLPSSGRLYFDDYEIREIDREHLRKEVGLILQESYIYSRTIAKNILLPNQAASHSEMIESARLAQLDSDIQRFNKGYDTIVGERGVTLSGGQKQRLAIARSFIRDCPILIFDDSLSALDAETDRKIRRDLKQRTDQLTTIIVSHRIASLLDCDRILVLNEGRMEAFASPEELREKPGLFSRVYDLQAAWMQDAEKARRKQSRKKE
ncbi:MAG: ABC transporter ATP-binding protein [Eubacteriales bacterium]|nr:ABC transporter ATP-binding protein [Eubacteriales bacterium]